MNARQKKKIHAAFYKAKSAAFEAADAEGSWTWRPTLLEVFTLGYLAAQPKPKQQREKRS